MPIDVPARKSCAKKTNEKKDAGNKPATTKKPKGISRRPPFSDEEIANFEKLRRSYHIGGLFQASISQDERTQRTDHLHKESMHTVRRQLANDTIDLAALKRNADFLSPLDKRHVPLRPDTQRVRDLATLPHFRQRLHETRIRCGHNVTLTVNVTSQPDCVVRWYKNDRTIAHRRRGAVHVYECGSGVWELHILDAVPADSGVYACVASNCAGEVRTSAFVNVEPAAIAVAMQKRVGRCCDGPMLLCTCERCMLTGCCGCDRRVEDYFGTAVDKRLSSDPMIRDARLSAVRCRTFVGYNPEEFTFEERTAETVNEMDAAIEEGFTTNTV